MPTKSYAFVKAADYPIWHKTGSATRSTGNDAVNKVAIPVPILFYDAAVA